MAILHFPSPDFAAIGAAVGGNLSKYSAWQSHDKGVKAAFPDSYASSGNYQPVSAKLFARNDYVMKVTA